MPGARLLFPSSGSSQNSQKWSFVKSLIGCSRKSAVSIPHLQEILTARARYSLRDGFAEGDLNPKQAS